jgi:hypothetical protein
MCLVFACLHDAQLGREREREGETDRKKRGGLEGRLRQLNAARAADAKMRCNWRERERERKRERVRERRGGGNGGGEGRGEERETGDRPTEKRAGGGREIE